MIEIIIGYGLLAVVIAMLLYERQTNRRDQRKVEQDLLDRIMATDYTQYSAIRVNTQQALERAGAKVEVIKMSDLEEHLQAGVPI